MWYGLRMSSKADPDFLAAAADLLRSTSRALILTTSAICLVWYLAASMTDWGMASLERAFLVALAVTVTAVVALYLLPSKLAAAQALWLVGLSCAIVLAVFLFGEPEIAFFFGLVPLMAVVTLGWPAGLLAEGLLMAMVWLLSHTLPGAALPFGRGLGIVAGGAIAGLLGWSVTRSLLTVTGWALTTYNRAWQTVQEMREQRLELKQVQEDLALANRELARLSDRLQAMYQVAEEARRAKEEFVANVSHELRTPLNMIIGFSELITELPEVYSDQLPPMLLADIAAIQRNSQHLSRLVDDVLDLSQIEAGRMALTREQASLPEIVGAAVAAVRDLFESKGLYLRTDVEDRLPPVFCDTTRIRQVLLNLLGNAGRFTERGGVRVKAWREKDEAIVAVADTGPGIAPGDRERLFEPFQQLDGSLHRRHGGSGLGLSISKRFVEMHGGRMWLESEVGAGTTFHFSLPLETPLPVALAGADDALRWFSEYGDYRYRLRTRRSLAPAPVVLPRYVLLEKGQALQRLLDRYLQGIETAAARSVGEAIAELRRSPAQALIVNASPFEETWGPPEQLKSLPYDTPLITCWVPGEDEAARRFGVLRYLLKPVARDGLLSALQGLGQEVERVLLVDDDQEILRLFSRMLASSGRRYRVLRATTGQRALSLLREERPQVMLLDLIMPGMDGFQVLREKSQDPLIRDIPVVIISSRDPGGEPIISDTLTVARSGGLSVRDVLACIQAISGILSPAPQPADRAQPGTPAA